MNLNNFNNSKFNYFLNKLADPAFTTSVQNDQLIVGKGFVLPEGSLEDNIRGVVRYLSAHCDELNLAPQKYLEGLEGIEKKLSSAAKAQDQEIQKILQPYLNKLKTLLRPAAAHKIESPCSPSTILLQVAAVPKNRIEFENNLQLVLNNFPRFQLHNDLSVFDSTFQSMPLDWDFDLMMDALLAELKKHNMHITSIRQDILNLLKIPVPIKMGIIIETSPINTTNTSKIIDFLHLVARKTPFLVNRHFFQAQAKQLPQLNLNTDVDIYLQKEGPLCVVIPKGKSLTDFGFNPKHLKISKGEHLAPSNHPLELAQDIQHLLVNETKRQRFYRLIEFNGHGTYPGGPEKFDITQPGIIAGLPTPDFQKTLTSLKKRNMVFLSLNTCFAGGANMASIRLPDQTIPCPVYIQSSFETMTYKVNRKEYDTGSILEEAQKIIFPPRTPGSPFLTHPHPLVEVDKQKLSLIMDPPNPTSRFANLGTLLLPANQRDIPKVTYTLAHPEQILDVSRTYNLKADPDSGILEDKNSNRKAFVFSDPITPFSLKVSSNLPMILLSRASHNHHILKEIIAPQQNIEDIAKETFNSFIPIKDNECDEKASKAFFVGHLKCKFEGKEADLSQVMIKSTATERVILFKLNGEHKFRRICFKFVEKNKGYPWRIDSTDTISLNRALKEIYKTIANSTPSTETLLQISAGRQSKWDFVEALNEIFFSKQIPLIAKLYTTLLQDKYQNPDKASAITKALNELEGNLAGISPKKIFYSLKQAYDLAGKLDLSASAEAIKLFSYTPLMTAVKRGDLDLAKTILSNNPETLEAESVTGSTALTIAMDKMKFEIAKLLIEQGANLNHTNKFGYTPFSLACIMGEPGFIGWILQTQGGFKGNEGGGALFKILENKNYKMAHFLIDHQVGIETDPLSFPLLGVAVCNSADKEIIRKLLLYPSIDINQFVNNTEVTSLHICISKNDIETLKFLLERGANPNKKNTSLVPPLQCVPFVDGEKTVELAQLLLEAGAEINDKDAEGQTVLHKAIAFSKDKGFIEFLIKRGASLQIENKDKKNPLELASEFPDLLEFILQIPGIDINPKNAKLDKLFQQTIMKGNVKLAKLLILHGVDINQPFKNSEPPCMFYLHNISSDVDPKPVIQFFIDNGADLTLQDSHGNSIMHLAMEKQDLHLFKCLREAKVSYDKPVNKGGITPFTAGLLSSNPQDAFLHELLSQDNELPKRDLAVILKQSLAKWDSKHPQAVMALMEEINPRSSIFEAMIIACQAILDKNSAQISIQTKKIKDNLKKIKDKLNKIKQTSEKKPADFCGLPILHAAFYLGFDSDEKTRELIIDLVDQFPECIHEKFIKPPTELTTDLTLLKALIQRGAEVSSMPKFEVCDLELLKLLDQKGIDFSGETGIHFLKQLISKKYTLSDQRTGIIFLLSKIKQSVHGPLSQAIQQEANKEIVNLLIDHPYLDPKGTDSEWGSPLSGALFIENNYALKKLLSMKAVYKVATYFEELGLINPFFILSMRAKSDELIEVAENLFSSELKVYLNGLNDLSSSLALKKCTPLVTAIMLGNMRLATWFINHGGDISLVNEAGNSPLHEVLIRSMGASEDQWLPFITLLLSKGAKWDIPNKDGLTAKDVATKLQLGKVLQLMQ